MTVTQNIDNIGKYASLAPPPPATSYHSDSLSSCSSCGSNENEVEIPKLDGQLSPTAVDSDEDEEATCTTPSPLSPSSPPDSLQPYRLASTASTPPPPPPAPAPPSGSYRIQRRTQTGVTWILYSDSDPYELRLASCSNGSHYFDILSHCFDP